VVAPLKIVALVVAMVRFALILVRSGQVVLFGRSVGRWSLYRSVARFPVLILLIFLILLILLK